MEPVEDPRTEKEELCGITFIGATGIEWICINKVHDTVYKSKRDGYQPSNNPQVDRHYFVPRYPFRVHQEEEWQKEEESHADHDD